MKRTHLGDMVGTPPLTKITLKGLKPKAKPPVKPNAKSKGKPNGKSKAEARRASDSQASFPFTRLPFEMQKEVFQYLLVADNDQILRPETSHEINNKACFQKEYSNPYNSGTGRGWFWNPTAPPKPLNCYHKTLETQILLVSHNVNSVALQVLYGCNRFYFSSASLFNQFTNTISPLGVQSLRYLAIDYPLPRSFQVSSLRRLVMGTEILDLQALELNMLNKNKQRKILWCHNDRAVSRRWHVTNGPSQAAERLVDLLDGLKETESIGNNEILMAINEKFDVNRTEVQEQLAEAGRLAESDDAGRGSAIAQYCKVKLTRKRK